MVAYRLDISSAEISKAFSAHAGPDPWHGGAVSVGQFAPVVTAAGKTSNLVLRPMHWGYPAPGQSTEMAVAGQMHWVPAVRNLDSPFWIGNLRHRELRCLVPMTSMSLAIGRRREPLVLRRASAGCFAAAGIWRDLTDMPVFAVLTASLQKSADPAKEKLAWPESTPVILGQQDWKRWLACEWPAARDLVHPLTMSDFIME